MLSVSVIPAINDLFLAVLDANIREAEKTNDTDLLSRLQQVHTIIHQIIMENTPPELQFVNELMQISDELEMRLKLDGFT